MRVQIPHGDETAFFQIAATLIPLLLFGGVVTDRLRRPSDKWLPNYFVAAYVPVAGSIAVVAEASAIKAVVTGTSSQFDRTSVALVLVAGMFSIIASVWLPWMKRLQVLRPREFRLVGAVSSVVLVASAISVLSTINDAMGSAATAESQTEFQMLSGHIEAEEEALHRHLTSLTEQFAHINQQMAAATDHGERDLPSFQVELEGTSRLMHLNVKEELRLELERANAWRELIGAPTLKKLPMVRTHH